MARFKLPATVLLLQVCRLSAEANGPADLLHRPRGAHDESHQQQQGARTGGAVRARAVRTRTHGGTNFVDPNEYEDGEVIDLSRHDGAYAAEADEQSDQPVPSRNLKGKTEGSIPSADDFSAESVDFDPTPDHDPDLDHFRTEHIFDPEYNGGDTFIFEEELAVQQAIYEGGTEIEYDDVSDSTSTELSPIRDIAKGGNGRGGGNRAKGISSKNSSKSSKGSGKGKGKGGGIDIDHYDSYDYGPSASYVRPDCKGSNFYVSATEVKGR